MISVLKSCKKLNFLHLQTCDEVTTDALIDLIKTTPISMKIKHCKRIESKALQESIRILTSQADVPLRLKSYESFETDTGHAARMILQKSH